MVQIECPSDCAWLASAREHPAAVVVRRQQSDLGRVIQWMRDFSERQSELFLLVTAFLVRYQPPEFQPLMDDAAAEAIAALAATYETASRGVIYDHRPASLPAERLALALKPVVAEAAKGGGSSSERDAAVVLRRIAEAAREVRATEPDSNRVFLDLLGRVLTKTGDENRAKREGSGLILQ